MKFSSLNQMNFAVMKHFYFGVPVLIVSVLLGITANCSASVTDQEFVGPYNTGANIGEGYQFVAMTYTAGITGTLAGLNVDVLGLNSNYPLHVAIHGVSQNEPTSTILGDALLATNGADLSQLITFPNQIAQTAGSEYAIVLDYQTAAGSGLGKGVWKGYSSGGYNGGQLFYSNDSVNWTTNGPDWDLHFRTYSTPVPEPSTLALLGMSAFGLLAWAWRRSRKAV